MADLIDIEFGDQRIRVPAWATEATLEAVMKYNEISARALNKLVGVETDGKKTFRVQEHYFKQIVDELQQTKKKQQELISQSKQEIKSGKEQVKAQVRATNKPTTKQDKTDYSKAFSDLSKSYSTSVDLLERSLLYLSKSLVDFNIILTKTSKTFEDMFKNIKGTSGATASNAGNTGNTGSSNTSNRTRDSRTNPSGNRVRERRDPSFMSEYTALVENLQEGIKPTEKLVKNLEKALQFTRIKELDKKDITDLKLAIEKLSAGVMPDPATIERMTDALDNYSRYTKDNITITKELKNYYLKYMNDEMNRSDLNREISRDIIRSQERLNRGLTDLVSSLGEGSLKGMATAIGSIVGLGSVAGFVAGILEDFSKNLSALADVSVGFGQNLDIMMKSASQAGLSLDNYSKLISENSNAIRSLGSSTQDGANKFSQLSEQLQYNAQSFNQFGLSNTEYNEILAQEIEIRRKSGMDSAEIYDSVSGSMNELLFQTNMLASITGQSSREMRRNMLEVMNDEVVSSVMRRLSATSEEADVNLRDFMSTLGKAGPIGNEISKAIISSIGTPGTDMYAYLSEDTRNAIALGENMLSDGFRDVFTFVKDNYASMPTDQFNAQLVEMTSNMDTPAARQQLERMPGNQAARTLLGILNNLEGMAQTSSEAMATQKITAENLKDSATMAIPSAIERMANELKAQTMTTVLENLSIDINSSGKEFVDEINGITKNLRDNGLVSGLAKTFGDLGTNTQLLIGGFGALALAVNTLPLALTAIFGVKMAGRGLTSLIAPAAASTTGTQAARGMMGFASPAAAASTAATAATAASTAAGTASNAGAAGAAAQGSKLASFLKVVPLIGDVITGYIHGSETGSIGRGIFAGVGSLAARTGAAAAGTATTGVGGVLIQGGASVAGGYGGAELYDYLFGEETPSGNMPESLTTGTNFNEMIATYLATISTTTIDSNYKLGYILEESMQSTILIRDSLSVHANTTNVWLRNLNGISETIRDDISQIKTKNNSLSNNNNSQNNASQNSESMLLLMSETNRLLQSLVRKYDESVQ